jgi:predicted enzyme related to lactoylglutathione lyase
VRALAPIVETLRAAGVNPLQPVLDLGEGKRVASFRDPDGNVFNVIEIR